MIKNLIIAILVSIALPFYILLLLSLSLKDGSDEVIIEEENLDITSLFKVFETGSKIEYDFKDSFIYKEYSE